MDEESISKLDSYKLEKRHFKRKRDIKEQRKKQEKEEVKEDTCDDNKINKFLEELLNDEPCNLKKIIEKHEKCSICWVNFKIKDSIRVLKQCRHIFH